MSFKRALVVDDSRSARVSLQRLLEEQELIVDLAVSGEEALDYLNYHWVDVIFMDHTMPGMDGLEAVSAIKSNPRTAMIPVMMYTTQEGEVYVGQARALGAVDVLPKQVQPGVLFEMLLKLGLVSERRAVDRPLEQLSEPQALNPSDNLDHELEQQALGMSVQALVTRILEDQHLKLRSDILTSHRDFAKQVASEVLQAHGANAPPTDSVDEVRQQESQPRSLSRIALVVAPLVILFVLYWQTRNDLESARTRAAVAEQQLISAQSTGSELQSAVSSERDDAQVRDVEFLGAMQWALNQGSHFAYDELPYNEARTDILRELLTNLAFVGFKGTVRLESHLGEFCLITDSAGAYLLADTDQPVEACTLIGHPLDDSSFVSDRQTIGFANFLAGTALLNGTGIQVELIAHDRLSSSRLHRFASTIRSAGEWNRIAGLNNRIEYSLISSAR
jgi:CheY-like chemotaxis protein